MKCIFLLPYFITICSQLSTAQERLDTSSLAKIKEEGLNHSQVMEISSWLSDVHAPRLNWSPEYREAAEWAVAKFKEYGAENVHFENFAPVGKGWSLKKFFLNITEPQVFPVIAYPKAWSPSTRGTINTEIVYCDAANESDLAKFHGKLKGKLIMISEPVSVKPHFHQDASRIADSTLLRLANRNPNDQGRMFRRERGDSTSIQRFRFSLRKLEFCQSEGAAAVLDANQGDDGTLLYVQGATVPQLPLDPAEYYNNRKNPYDADAPAFAPQVTVSSEQYNRLVRTIQKGISVKAEMRLDVETAKADSSFNIIAEIPGTDLKNEVVLIGAHFDTWHSGTGATDNGSGDAVCFETLRIIRKLGLQPRRTIRVCLWGGEEEGLLGSRAYVKQHYGERQSAEGRQGTNTNGPVVFKPEANSFSVYFNNDNGGGRVRGIYMQGNEATRSIFRAWLSAYADPIAQTLTIANTGGTDHQAFDGIGLPGFQFIQDPMDYGSRTRHSNMDVYDRLVEEDMKQAATLMAVFAYNAAMRDLPFPRIPTIPQVR